jgi:hypothetical protein
MKLLRTLFVASGVLALSAASLSAQAAAQQVTCKDGAKSAGGRGACSGHGGIAVTAKADAKIAKTETKADAKIAKTEAKADAKMEKTAAKADVKTEKAAGVTKVAKHSKKAKGKKAKA